MKKIAVAIFTIATVLVACKGEDFIDDLAFFEPQFSIDNRPVSGIDTVFVGEEVTYSATFSNAGRNDDGAAINWESSRLDVASIDNDGKLTALAPGATNILASSNGLEDSLLVVVQSFERIEISASSTSLIMGDQLQLTAQYFDVNNNLTAVDLDWRSSDVSVASIDSSGNVTALSFGTTTITASFNGIVSNSIVLDVLNMNRIDLTVPDTFLVIGQQLNATAQFFDQTGTQTSATFTWNSSNTNIATVDNSGVISGLTTGRTEITASADGITSNIVAIEIIDDTTVAVSVDISSPGTSITVGSTLQFSGDVKNINGTVLPNETIQWNSSNPSILNIDANGLAMGLGAGTSTITGTSANGKTSNSIVVNVLNLQRVELSVSDSIVVTGQQLTASANYFDQTGTQTSASFTWNSSNPSIATIDNSGTITGMGIGVTQITAVANGVTSNSISIEVINDTTIAASVDVVASGTSIVVGDTLQLSAVVRNINGKILPNQPVQWSSTDTTVLGVNASGIATAITVGSSTVNATSGGVQSNGTNILVTPATTNSRSGTFTSANGYTTNGTVQLNMVGGNLQLDFSNFSTNGSGALYIYMSNINNGISGGIQLQRLNFRNGAFTVPVPASVNINTYNYVVIWCQGIGASFGSARLM